MMMHRSLQRMARQQQSIVARGFASDSKDFIGLVGIGQMGAHMATNLLAKGQKVVVCDVNPESTKPLAAKGAIVAATAREVAEKCDRVLTMLPNTGIVENVYLHDKDGFRDVVRPGQLFIDSSTIDAIFTKKLSDIYHDKKALIVDAPVSGGVIGAENGTLTFMVGGTDEEFQTVKPTLEFMGRNIVHCGSSSLGQVAKMCNNLSLVIQMASVAEAMNLGVKLGMDPQVLRGIMNTSTAQCWSSSLYHPYPGLMENVPAAVGYKGGFSSALVKKDLGLGVDAAKAASVSLPLTYAAHQLYSMIVNDGHGNKDFGYILQYLKGKQD